MAAEGGAQAGTLGLHHHVPQHGFRHEVEQVASVLGQRVNQEAVAPPLFGQLDHQVRVQAVFKQQVVGEQGADEFGLRVTQGFPGIQQDLAGGFVFGYLETHLDRRSIQQRRRMDGHGLPYRAGWVRRPA